MECPLFNKEAHQLRVDLTDAEFDVLFALRVRGPVHISGVPSKPALHSLLSKGIATQLSGDKDQYFELGVTGHQVFDLLRKHNNDQLLALKAGL